MILDSGSWIANVGQVGEDALAQELQFICESDPRPSTVLSGFPKNILAGAGEYRARRMDGNCYRSVNLSVRIGHC